MGRDKAMLPFQGQPLVAHAVGQLRAAGCAAIIAGARPDLADYAPVVEDLHPGCGPLGGIEAALAAAQYSQAVLFLPVDLPLLPVSFLRLLLERARQTGALATVPMLGGWPQPLCAVYGTPLLCGITPALDAGEYKVMPVIKALTLPGQRDCFSVEAVLAARSDLLDQFEQVGQVGQKREPKPVPPHRWFANINTPAEFLTLAG
jgi:molybdopterin-guanine dinucleotide biosynthesis protein A